METNKQLTVTLTGEEICEFLIDRLRIQGIDIPDPKDYEVSFYYPNNFYEKKKWGTLTFKEKSREEKH